MRKLLFIIICPLCTVLSAGAQEQKKVTETQSVIMGSQDPEVSVQSVSTASGDKLQHRPVYSMENTFDGVVSGLFVNTSQGYLGVKPNLRLRGNTPLIVVDGIPRANPNIPASQIESISVIKDGLGLSMMGMNSGNGVVYIKTKRGKLSSMKIDFTAQYAIGEQTVRPRFLNAYQYAGLLNEGLVNEGKAPMYSQTDLDLYRTGASPYTHPDVDWQKMLLRNNSPIQQYNLNVSGGGKSARYFIDLNVYDQEGYLKQDNSINSYNTRENAKKYSLRTNTDINITDHTLFKVNLFGQMLRETTPGSNLGAIYRDMYSVPNNAFPMFNPNGSLGATPVYQNANLYGKSILSGYYFYPSTDFNIDATLEHYFQGALKGLFVGGTYSYNSSYSETLNRSKTFNTFSYWKDPTDPTAVEVYQPMASASAQSNSSGYRMLNRLQYMELALGYDLQVKKHAFKAKALYSYSDYIVSATKIPLGKNAISFRGEYNYDKRYLAEIAVSGMNMNSLKPGEQWGVFPSVGAGWNMHKEAWFHAPAINALKLRATFGINGNDGMGANFRDATGILSSYYYTYIKYYTNSEDVYFGSTPTKLYRTVESQLPYLSKWEKVTRWNFGVDVELFDKSLSATIEYFNNTYSDVLQQSVSKASNRLIGMTLPNENLGKYRRSGIELSATYNKKFGDVAFTASGNALIYKSTLLANGENPYPESYMNRVGERYGQTFGYVADGFFQNQQEIDQYLATTKIPDYTPQPGDLKYRDLNGDHILDGKDVKAIGTHAPLIEYGIFVGAEWKGLALSMQWAGIANRQTTSKMMPFASNTYGGYGQALEEHLDRWTPENPNARYPRVTAGANNYNEYTSTFWLKSSSFLRLKNVELSYTLPKAWTSPARVGGVKLFVNGYNLLTLTGLKDRDPEMVEFLSGSSVYAPNTKAYNFGINIQF